MSAPSTDNASRAGIALAFLALCALPAHAQPQPSRVVALATAVAAPAEGARIVGSVPVGVRVAAGERRGGWVAVSLEGWLDQAGVGGPAEAFPRSVLANGARLRAAPGGRGQTLAFLQRGAGVEVLGTQGRFLKVRRAAWVRGGTLVPAAPLPASPAVTTAPLTPKAPATPPAAVTAMPSAGGGRGVRAVPRAAQDQTPALVAEPPGPNAVPVPDGALRAGASAAELRTAPDARPLATLRTGTLVVPLAREGGWVRVRVEGWVRERDMVPADSGLKRLLSAADLRADPEGTRGAVVRWEVDVLGFQTADGLRRDLADGEPYLLAKGPAGEEALLYLALPPSLEEEGRRLQPMSRVLVTARVRAGRSEPTGVPVLDVQSIARPR